MNLNMKEMEFATATMGSTTTASGGGGSSMASKSPHPRRESFVQRYKFLWPIILGINFDVGDSENHGEIRAVKEIYQFPCCFCGASIAWIAYELYFNATDPLSDLWRISWIIPAFWGLLAYYLLGVICVLWAPSKNPTSYIH